jgi:hypothetical protein
LIHTMTPSIVRGKTIFETLFLVASNVTTWNQMSWMDTMALSLHTARLEVGRRLR